MLVFPGGGGGAGWLQGVTLAMSGPLVTERFGICVPSRVGTPRWWLLPRLSPTVAESLCARLGWGLGGWRPCRGTGLGPMDALHDRV